MEKRSEEIWVVLVFAVIIFVIAAPIIYHKLEAGAVPYNKKTRQKIEPLEENSYSCL